MEDQNHKHPKILFVVPRLHTNLIGWLDGLSLLGLSVKVLVQTCGKSEDHSRYEPERLDPGVDNFIITKSTFKDISQFSLLARFIRNSQPDLIIFRFEMNFTSLIFLLNILSTRKTFMIYQQWPIYDNRISRQITRSLISRALKVPFITPVLSLDEKWIGKLRSTTESQRVFFVPFGIPMRFSTVTSLNSRQKSTSYKFLSIGKFQERKKHLETIKLLLSNENFRNSDATFEIVGEVSTPEHQRVHDEITKFISLNRLELKVSLTTNQEHAQALLKIEQCDVFVLMSEQEPASVSNLESMSFGKPVIIKSGNGTANYLKNGHGGFIVSSTEEFHRSVDYFFENPDFCEASCVSNVLVVREMLDPKSVARRLLNIAGYSV